MISDDVDAEAANYKKTGRLLDGSKPSSDVIKLLCRVSQLNAELTVQKYQLASRTGNKKMAEDLAKKIKEM